MGTIDPTRDWKTLLSYLPQDYGRLAEEHKQLNTQWSNAKIRTADDLLRLIFVHVGADLPLRQTVTVVARGGGPQVAPVRLHYKMRRAAPYLGDLVQRMNSFSQQASPERWGGYELVAVDGSTVSGPGSEGTDARLHVALRLSDLRAVEVHVTDPSEGETLRRFGWTADQLVLGDRGYANPPGIAWVVDQGADVLLRVNRGALPVFDSSIDEVHEAIDVLQWCRALEGHRATERRVHVQVQVQGPRQREPRKIEGRLIAMRLPEQEAAEAQQRVQREEGGKASAEQLEAACYVIVFTTTPARRMSAARCVEAYRLRWQVELQFKRWKSLCHFDRLPNYRDDTIQSWLTAKLLLGLLLDRMGSVETIEGSSSIPSGSPRRAIARQAWKITSVLWPMIIAAILPMGLHETIRDLPKIAYELDALDDDTYVRQVDRFRDRFYPYDVSVSQDC
jgi:hypothetical protein